MFPPQLGREAIMLRNIRVNGFRSLVNFEIDLTPGLNVLVGSNGTGKSNFISFLDFVGVLLQQGLNPAIAVAQGAGSVFSKEMFNDDSAELEFTASGTVTPPASSGPYFNPDQSANGIVDYRYKCRINYIRSLPAVYISYESMETTVAGKSRLEIIRSTHINEGKFSSEISFLPKNHSFVRDAFRWARRDKSDKFDLQEFIKENISIDRSVLNSVSGEYQPIFLAMRDIMGYRSINIDPAIARKPTPVGSSTKLLPTGEGLAGVLYQLQQGTYQPSSYLFYRRPDTADVQRKKFESIMSWCREVNPDIARVSVELDFQEAQLRPSMTFDLDGDLQAFPLGRISDGTVKWLTLASILFMDEELAVIEEPENFLHPFMQEAFIGLCRHILDGHESKYLLISTHSPTLLDCCSPSELTIFETKSGHTRASRVSNREELAEKIARSRFGLGYYYKIGGLYGEDRSIG
jgi:predicted ATPase